MINPIFPTQTAAHLANTGKALLLVPVEPPAELAQENLYLALDNSEPRQLWYWAGDAGDEASDAICRPRPPHAPGDVIQIPFEVDDPTCVLACRPARVIEVLPPVRVKDLSEDESCEAGFEPFNISVDPESPGSYALDAREYFHRKHGSDATYVWRVKVTAATAAEPKE